MHLSSIQTLRGLAALMVAIYHLILNEQAALTAAGTGETALLLDLTRNGFAGVDLFFVISGFIMVHVTTQRPRGRLAALDFLLARFARIYPLWWLFSAGFLVSIMLATGALTPPAYEIAPAQEPAYLLRSFLLLPQDHLPYIVVGWTLVHELYFYLVFAAFLLAPQRWLPALLAGWMVLVSAGSLTGLQSPQARDLISLILHPLTLEFIAGAAAALLIARGATRAAWPALIAGVAGLLAALILADLTRADTGGGWMRLVWFGLPSTLIVYGLVAVEKTRNWRFARPLTYLGDISYGLYLGHVVIYLYLTRAMEIVTATLTTAGAPAWLSAPFDLGRTGPLDNLTFALAGLAGALLVAMIAHHAFERPSLNWLAARRRRLMTRLGS